MPHSPSRRQKAVIFAVFVTFLMAASLSKWSSRAPQAWDDWAAHNPAGTQPVDHSVWDKLLQSYVRPGVDGLNRFDYGGVSVADKQALKSYLEAMTAVAVSDKSRDVQLAFWLNLYNALTIDVVLDHYPVSSIRDIDISGLLSNGPWGADLIEVEGGILSLNAIEHEILRPIWADPRIHYGVNCASVGCPNLHTSAFNGATVYETLDRLAQDFVNSPRAVQVSGTQATVSSIYSWFAYDFGNSAEGILTHLRHHAAPELLSRLGSDIRLTDHQYDWSLNDNAAQPRF